MRARDQQSSRPQQAVKLAQPHGLIRFVQVSKDRARVDDIEGIRRQLHGRVTGNAEVAAAQVPGRPGDGLRVDVHTPEVMDRLEPHEVASDPAGAAPEVEPAGVALARVPRGEKGALDRGERRSPDGEKVATPSGTGDTKSQTGGGQREHVSRAPNRVEQIGDEVSQPVWYPVPENVSPSPPARRNPRLHLNPAKASGRISHRRSLRRPVSRAERLFSPPCGFTGNVR
jgi:hypothetical protein